MFSVEAIGVETVFQVKVWLSLKTAVGIPSTVRGVSFFFEE